MTDPFSQALQQWVPALMQMQRQQQMDARQAEIDQMAKEDRNESILDRRRQRVAEDFKMQVEMGKLGRQVLPASIGPAVSESRELIPGISASSMQIQRPADPSRLMTWDRAGGGEMQVEAYTPEELEAEQQRRRKIEDLRQFDMWRSQAKAQQEMAIETEMAKRTMGVDMPTSFGSERVMMEPRDAANLVRAQTAQMQAEQEAQPVDLTPWVDAVVRNPEALQALPRNMQAQLIPELSKRGFTQFAKPKQAAGSGGGGATSGDGDAEAVADAIIRGDQSPVLTGLYRNTMAIRAQLAKKGFKHAQALSDWNAVQKHLSTLNGAQQERLRQAVTFTYDSLDVIEGLFQEWEKLGRASGFPLLNKAQLAMSKQIPGKTGEVARNLEAQINDLTAELGTVYKGGNASTDESLRLAAENLKADWNPGQFKKALGLIRQNLQIRKNSILNSQPVGVNPGSPYAAGAAGGNASPHAPGSAKVKVWNPATNRFEDK